MTTVVMLIVMLFSPVFGWLFLRKEAADHAANRERFKVFLQKVENPEDRLKRAKELYLFNGYSVEEKAGALIVRKKHFSIGKLLFGYFFAGIGAVVYVIWFLYFERPDEERLEF